MGLLQKLYRLMVYCFMVPMGLFLMLLAIFTFALKFGPMCLFRKKKQYLERPSCMDDPQLGTHGYVSTSFGNIHYVASGPRDKPLMLLVHGFPENWHSWRHQILEFQKEYRVVAMDTRGAGESQKSPSVSNFTVDKLSLDIKDVLTSLGYSSCVLVGHDWGGVIAFDFAGAYPDLVDKLIIINSAEFSHMENLVYNTFKQMWMSWYFFAYSWPWFPEFMISIDNFRLFSRGMYGKDNKYVTKEDIEALKYGLSLPGTLTSQVNYYRANMRLFGAAGKRNAILCPTAIIWGMEDKFLGFALTTGNDKYIQDLTIIKIEGAAHFPHQQKPPEVNQAMRGFLQGDGSEEVVNIIS